MKKRPLILLAVCISIFTSSCVMNFKAKMTITPPLEEGSVAIMYTSLTTTDNKGPISSLESKVYRVNSGNKIQVYSAISTLPGKSDTICRTVKIEGIINGRVIETHEYEMGGMPGIPIRSNCKDGIFKTTEILVK